MKVFSPQIIYNLKGSTTILLESPGSYKLELTDVKVVDCYDLNTVDNYISSSSFTTEISEFSATQKKIEPIYTNNGRISVSGSQPFTLSNSLFTSNSYTLSFLLKITGDLKSDFGTLWFKGSGHANDRTPSCFLKSDGLIFQISTGDNPEYQVESDFVFVKDETYYIVIMVNNNEYKTYINNALITSINSPINSPLKHNEYDFNIGWAEGIEGVEMDLSVIRVWEGVKLSKDRDRDWERIRLIVEKERNCVVLHGGRVSVNDDAYMQQMIDNLMEEINDIKSIEGCNEPKKRLRIYEDLADLDDAYGAMKAGEMHVYGTEYEELGKRYNSEYCDGLELKDRSEEKGVSYLMKAHELGSDQDNLNNLSLDLLFKSARSGNKLAALSLANKYQKGYAGLEKNMEAALYYAKISSDSADVYFHKTGNQPYHEMHRLRVGHEIELLVGESGSSDSELQYTIMMSEKGDIEAMSNYAMMLYWGARGFERDHVKALELWNGCAEVNHIGGLCGAASMYVRGEGGEVDMRKAVEYYERAAEMNVPTALNGLGYAYFYGQGGMEVDQVKAFEYFLKAASLEQDSDSLTNAAHCYATGQGVEEDQFKAATLYDKAATKFGNFDSALEMGRRFATGGRGTDRNPVVATNYLMSASRVGESGELVRKGFDLFMRGEHDAALKVYAEAAELGYEVGANNAAYLLDVGAASISSGAENTPGVDEDTSNSIVLYDGEGYDKDNPNKLLNKAASLRFHWMAAEDGNAESFAAIGDSYYWGVGADQDHDNAFWWYSKSASAGSIKGSYYVAFMHEFHTEDLDRALSQYGKVLKLVEGGEEGLEMIFLVKFSMWRCEMKKGKLYQLARKFWWKRSGKDGFAPLPQLPIVKPLDEDEEEFETADLSGEGGDLSVSSRLIGAMAKARYIGRDLFYQHRGKVFGLNQSEDLGYDVKWGNVVVAGLVGLLFVSLIRVALGFFR
ncbi:hypothetical protein TL16_g07299 [Triparma laevis f. inornata]|uniref:Uncharacterized protein n=1 Tax=Triparma laevis f. inornata TaxID=1714386 RepID=A0A9W7AV10_9STRA|nr:hypothetical protein TL16_g07299 [Triparma laevis f. inornata]